MNHCVIMTVYKDVEQINRFIDSAPNNFDFYVHVDKKSTVDICEISNRAKVFSLYRIYWGGIEHLKAFLFLLEEAYSSSIEKYDFYHLVTGQDFFSCTFEEFDKILKKGYSYIEIFKLPRGGWWNGGLDILKYKTLASKLDLRKKRNKVIDYLYRRYQFLFGKSSPLPEYPMAGGSVYCSLWGG